jgi:hypothetical protein
LKPTALTVVPVPARRATTTRIAKRRSRRTVFGFESTTPEVLRNFTNVFVIGPRGALDNADE